MEIKITNREGALQVGSHKQIAQGTPNAGDQFFEDGIELRIWCPMIHRRSSLRRAVWHFNKRAADALALLRNSECRLSWKLKIREPHISRADSNRGHAPTFPRSE